MSITISQVTLYSKNSDVEIPMFHCAVVDPELFIITASDKAESPFLMDFSVFTLYLSVILVIGKFIRDFISGCFHLFIHFRRIL